MAKINIDHKHKLDNDEARSKLEKLVDQLEKKYSIKCTWNGDDVDLKGTGVKGKLSLGQGRLHGFVDVPFFLKGKVEKALSEKMGKEFPA